MATSERYSKEENYSSTLNAFKYNFTWTINDFEFVCKNVKVIRSKEFSTNNFSDCKWLITMEPTELIRDNKDVFKINFHYHADLMDEKLLNVQISFKRQVDLHSFEIFKTFENENGERGENIISWKISGSDLYEDCVYSTPEEDELSILLDRLEPTVPYCINVICNIDVVFPDETIFQKPLIDIGNCIGLIESNKNFLDNEEFKDVTFNVEDQKFTAHKIILASRSPVFAAMFKNKMTEGLTSVVEIDDTKPAIFQQMLNFIYTDRVENLEESAFELLYVAEKYQLEKLKILSINSLNDKLSINTVIKTLEVAELYSIENLKNECLKFINDNRYEIIETKEFQKLLLDRPNLSIDILKINETRGSECCKSYELR
ncbi:speckle-type POZ protein-like [Leptopilina heterotoma]|uniref:speckle-type POZ protein-like n=1 Tax=Leptopilina heterotoma TaxID=63436 RepID=UPI001CA839C9|nr:speckle-type POZ protein-like [Leptopilina heterotoma]